MKIKKSIFLLIISILILGCQNDEPQISSNNLSTTTTESIEVVENEAQMVLLLVNLTWLDTLVLVICRLICQIKLKNILQVMKM